jgi:hypothetical protein
MNRLDWFGRRCLAWPAMLAGAGLTIVGGGLLKFAAWILDMTFDDDFDTGDDY